VHIDRAADEGELHGERAAATAAFEKRQKHVFGVTASFAHLERYVGLLDLDRSQIRLREGKLKQSFIGVWTAAALASRFPAVSRISTSVNTTGENQPSEAPPEAMLPPSPGSAIAKARLRRGVFASTIGKSHIKSA
jgi:hypothetical protein